jgi:hypothetical protein
MKTMSKDHKKEYASMPAEKLEKHIKEEKKLVKEKKKKVKAKK